MTSLFILNDLMPFLNILSWISVLKRKFMALRENEYADVFSKLPVLYITGDMTL